MIEYIVAGERPFAARFDETAARELAGRVFDRSTDLSASLTEAFEFDLGEPWRQRLGEITAPTLVIHGSEDPMFPYGHARALANEIPGAELIALEHTGHEYFPRAVWGLVVPAILRHTAGERHDDARHRGERVRSDARRLICTEPSLRPCPPNLRTCPRRSRQGRSTARASR